MFVVFVLYLIFGLCASTKMEISLVNCNSEFSVLCKSFSSVKLLGYDVVFSVFANEKDNLKFIEYFAYFRVQSTNSNASNLHGVSNEHSL